MKTITAGIKAVIAATAVTAGARRPSIARLVSDAKIPPAGVNPPYIADWKAAAIEP